MMFSKKNEETKRIKLKLQLYGSYTREIEVLEHRYFEIEQELQMNDNIKNAARNLGIKGSDPYHPADEKLQLEYASIELEMKELEIERTYLGIDYFVESLDANEKKIIVQIFVRNLSQSIGGEKIGFSRRATQRRLDKIYEKWTSWRTCPHENAI